MDDGRVQRGLGMEVYRNCFREKGQATHTSVVVPRVDSVHSVSMSPIRQWSRGSVCERYGGSDYHQCHVSVYFGAQRNGREEALPQPLHEMSYVVYKVEPHA